MKHIFAVLLLFIALIFVYNQVIKGDVNTALETKGDSVATQITGAN